jgi:phosphate starvation-inducible protein PhoH and related proteins
MQNKKKVKKTKQVDYFDFSVGPTTKPYIEPLKPKTIAQNNYINAIKNNEIIFSTGPAGTGKTYVVASMAAEMLANDNKFTLIITRPAITADKEDLGALPGELEEKYSPYVAPIINVLEERLGKSFVKYLIAHKRIELQPLGYMRGSTFNDAWAILDEAQNTTINQMKMFLTRIGKNAKLIIDGDTDQTDIVGRNGLQDAKERLTNIASLKFIEFSEHDIVRNGIIKQILQAYRN